MTSSTAVQTGLADSVIVFVGLFLLAALTAMALKKLRFPYTIGLFLIGMLLGLAAEYLDFLSPVLTIDLSHDLIMYVFLPVLVFEAALNIKLNALLNDLVPVLLLAVVGVVFSTLIIAGMMGSLTSVSLAGALLFGALISATDPVAVIALFRELKAPERLSTLMDAESLFNDATAIVMFGIVLAFIQAGGVFSQGLLVRSVLEFIQVFFGGILVGALMAFGMLYLLRAAKEIPFVQIAHTTILAFGSFIIADHVLSLSGVMAVIAAGTVTRAYGENGMSEYTKMYLGPYWEFMAFVANSFVFLMLGLKEDVLFKDWSHFLSEFPILIAAVIFVLIARFMVVYLLVPASNALPGGRSIDGCSKAVMFWGGLRGVVPVALMLSIPDSVPEKRLIIDMALFVILFSLVVQGATIERLMTGFGMNKPVAALT